MKVCDVCQRNGEADCLEPDTTLSECVNFRGDIEKIKALFPDAIPSPPASDLMGLVDEIKEVIEDYHANRPPWFDVKRGENYGVDEIDQLRVGIEALQAERDALREKVENGLPEVEKLIDQNLAIVEGIAKLDEYQKSIDALTADRDKYKTRKELLECKLLPEAQAERDDPNAKGLYRLAEKYGWGKFHSRPACCFIMDAIKALTAERDALLTDRERLDTLTDIWNSGFTFFIRVNNQPETETKVLLTRAGIDKLREFAIECMEADDV